MKNSLTALREVSKLQQQQLQSLTKAKNLTISEWQLLLSIADGYDKQESLSKEMALDTSTLSRQLKRLVEKEMVQKKAIGKDKRQLVYTISDLGNQSIKDIAQSYTKLKNRIFEQWSEDEKNMLKILLNRLGNSMKKINK
ncbi:MarR family winged helix-turn-helix transcriptional regulator [Fructilactobacillus frigidiflavus]|uniref:MarR family winged helix-turn-helix transcriptional regulator n=1 Tax=Fructilactobacillus frigidiflavus TaxID=3242688 RepID=UPI00375728A6